MKKEPFDLEKVQNKRALLKMIIWRSPEVILDVIVTEHLHDL